MKLKLFALFTLIGVLAVLFFIFKGPSVISNNDLIGNDTLKFESVAATPTLMPSPTPVPIDATSDLPGELEKLTPEKPDSDIKTLKDQTSSW